MKLQSSTARNKFRLNSTLSISISAKVYLGFCQTFGMEYFQKVKCRSIILNKISIVDVRQVSKNTLRILPLCERISKNWNVEISKLRFVSNMPFL